MVYATVMPKLPSSRPPLTRMLAIHELLQAGKPTNATKLSKELEVSRKTIVRDINFMRDQMCLPIEWDASENTYFYNGTVDAFPTVTISEGELFALLVAEQSIRQYQGTPYEEPLRGAMQKLSEGLSNTAFLSLDKLDTPVSFKPLGVGVSVLDTFQKLNRAVIQGEEVTFNYKGISDKKAKKRRVQPWHLACVDNQWYCVCWDLERKARRTFALVRMDTVDLTGKYFDKPEDFDIQKHLKDSLGIFIGNEKHTVELEFNAFAAKLIQEKDWHPSQEVTELPDGRIQLAMTLSDLWEVERWVLSWGKQVKVLGPAELKKRIKAHAAGVLESLS